MRMVREVFPCPADKLVTGSNVALRKAANPVLRVRKKEFASPRRAEARSAISTASL
jgi:hypothetical protein